MLNNNYIKGISELYNIPKSTLRYWHSEGLIHFERDSSNDYRTFSLKTVMDIGDIAFYRSLNVPVNELKHLQEKNADELEVIIQSSGRKVQEQIIELQETMKKIETRLKRIEQYRQLGEEPYSISKPNFKRMITSNYMEQESPQKFLSDPYSAAILFPFQDRSASQYGFVVDDNYEGRNILWSLRDEPTNFIYCLLRVDYGNPNPDCLDEHRNYFQANGYDMGIAVGRYLFTAYDQKLYDYHEGWIEIRSE